MTIQETRGDVTGRVVAIRRYPVKSMAGEELEAAEVTDRGLLGDRAYALIDAETGKVASAKNPRRWPNLFDFRANFSRPVLDARTPPPASITLAGGEVLATDQPDIERRLSEAVGRPVHLAQSGVEGAVAEEYLPDHDWLPRRDAVVDFPIPEGTFFDCAAVHLVTTATLGRLQASNPESRFDVRRFRPNFVIETPEAVAGFVENDWIGLTLAIGDVRLRVDGPCPRCVMTTLPQGDLPKDPAVLRAAVRQNGGHIGVYATVVQGGRVRLGDAVATD